MIVKELLELLKYVPEDLLLTVLDQHGLEYPLGAPTITLEGGVSPHVLLRSTSSVSINART